MTVGINLNFDEVLLYLNVNIYSLYNSLTVISFCICIVESKFYSFIHATCPKSWQNNHSARSGNSSLFHLS